MGGAHLTVVISGWATDRGMLSNDANHLCGGGGVCLGFSFDGAAAGGGGNGCAADFGGVSNT